MSEVNKITSEKFIDYFKNLEEAFKNGKVECIIKIHDKLYPEAQFTTMAPCICELTQNEIILNSRNALSITWQKDIKEVKRLNYSGIDSIKLSILKKLNGVLGMFPSYFLSLQMDIEMKNNLLYSFECNSFDEIPDMLELFISNEIEIIDPLNLQNLYREKTSLEVTEYLHKNYDNLTKVI